MSFARGGCWSPLAWFGVSRRRSAADADRELAQPIGADRWRSQPPRLWPIANRRRLWRAPSAPAPMPWHPLRRPHQQRFRMSPTNQRMRPSLSSDVTPVPLPIPARKRRPGQHRQSRWSKDIACGVVRIARDIGRRRQLLGRPLAAVRPTGRLIAEGVFAEQKGSGGALAGTTRAPATAPIQFHTAVCQALFGRGQLNGSGSRRQRAEGPQTIQAARARPST
jgi:hypothetical protein